ncbi:retrovirus-related pol polyprotein from transposon TNT 1-94 [Tanacetum coccineum]|uniref:Retrovirus-related pol polyprotein from transposon TNT 1-94 n=1 Tax=Tanacetum coccineum TaxID=301880 RepID=A0ABQ5FGC8_9ASTR
MELLKGGIRTLIEAARTMLADSKLPTTFWAEAVNTACYVQNRVLVVKPHNKTPYELFHGRTPTLSFMRQFRVFFVGYLLNSKAFRVFNSRTRIVEENLHIRFSESTPNVVGSRPDWLFDIDALTRTMNYEPIVVGTQSNGFVGTKASVNAGQASKVSEPVKNYILLPLWDADPPFSQNPKRSKDDRSKPSIDDEKKVDEDPKKDSECNDQEKEDNVNSTNNVNVASTNEVNVVGKKTSIEFPFDPKYTAFGRVSIFDSSIDNEDDGVEADINDLDTTIQFGISGLLHQVVTSIADRIRDPRIPDGQAAQTTIPNNDAFQTKDLDAYDSDCDDVSNANVVLMANLSNYGSDVILEEKANQEKNNESLTAELERYKERVKSFEERLNVDLNTREKMIDSQMDDMIKENLALKQQIDSLEQTLSNQIKEKESLLQTFIVFKNESKDKESKNLDKEIDLEKNIKELDNIC